MARGEALGRHWELQTQTSRAVAAMLTGEGQGAWHLLDAVS